MEGFHGGGGEVSNHNYLRILSISFKYVSWFRYIQLFIINYKQMKKMCQHKKKTTNDESDYQKSTKLNAPKR